MGMNTGRVIRSRAPLRLGLAGGGTDLSSYSNEFGGAVLNCTIDRYAFAFISPGSGEGLTFKAKDLGLEERFADAGRLGESRLVLHRGVYERIVNEFNKGQHLSMTITTSVDAPVGSGLGSSSALVVALIEAFRNLLDLPLGQYDVARLAVDIERSDLCLAGGKQDQYSAAFGGINFIEFLRDDRAIVNPLRVPKWIWNELESSMVIAFSGQSRHSEQIIRQQQAALSSQRRPAIEALHQLKTDAVEMKRLLLQGSVRGMAEILNRSWESKKATAVGVTNPRIDDLYQVARDKGALAGKVSGAGGGGFMMFLTQPDDRLDLIQALGAAGATASPVKFTEIGCETWQTPI
jgi:D-glycero-alpha-D-manno-heptose-7-phosphate kinase